MTYRVRDRHFAKQSLAIAYAASIAPEDKGAQIPVWTDHGRYEMTHVHAIHCADQRTWIVRTNQHGYETSATEYVG